ncbi:MAG TPA: ABC transporter substrate-binding protein [Gaiellaceae bacterium]|jgi:peptide/nickel transport system substrate-binding protein
MRKRLWYTAPLSLIAVSVLAALLAVTASAQSSASNASGTLNFGSAGADVDFTDPALAYGVLSWQIEYETCLQLVNYPDKTGAAGSQLQPDAAAAMPVISNGGKTYTFTIKKGLKFSDGATVSPADFVWAFNRDANPAMQSPVIPFITDVVGVNDVVNKKAKAVTGVKADGQKFIINLTKPDGALLAKLTMPFFCAVERAKTPIDPKGLNTLPGAGPYYIASRTPGKQLVLKKNPFYKGDRPARSSTMVFTMNTNDQQTYLQVTNGTYAADPNGLDVPTAAAGLAKKYGINKSRFWVNSLVETDYLALNTANKAFGSLAARKAANYAVDRPAVLRARGFEGGVRTSTILPKALAGGYWGQKIYATKGADPAKAKQLNPNCGHVNLWGGNTTLAQTQEGIVRYNLTQAGCDVTVKQFGGYAIYTAAGTKGADFDIMFSGWNQDYPDPIDFFGILLDGRNIHAQNNNNLAYINNAELNKKIDQANAITGEGRLKAFGKLDIWTTTHLAPWVSIDNRNLRDYIGPNVAGYVFQPAKAAMDLGTLYLK